MALQKYARIAPQLPYRSILIIATEGEKTEPLYFRLFRNNRNFVLHILGSRKKTSPLQVFNAALSASKKMHIKSRDEVWIVIDKDSWQTDRLNELCVKCAENHFELAVSNPNFEYWLLLHFEEGNSIKTAHECMHRLTRYLPNYRKNKLELQKLSPLVRDAVVHARKRDDPPCDVPAHFGSRLYRLVEKLL